MELASIEAYSTMLLNTQIFTEYSEIVPPFIPPFAPSYPSVANLRRALNVGYFPNRGGRGNALAPVVVVAAQPHKKLICE